MRTGYASRVILTSLAALLFGGVVMGSVLGGASPANAHGFSSVVYAKVSAPSATVVRATLALEYDLMLVSVATSEKDDPFDKEGQPAWDNADFPGMTKAVNDHLAAVSSYVLDRFTVTTATGAKCVGKLQDAATVKLRDAVPYANVIVDFTCPPAGRTESGHIVRSTLFPDEEQYVTGTKTIVVYDADAKSGTATLDSTQPSFSTEQSWLERFWEFFKLGAEHLLTGIDHILFLVALIVGSRRLREVVLAASAFTVAHSITFILAALGVVSPPSIVVEPTIALSIAAVAGWYLWRLARRGNKADQLLVTSRSHFALDRAGWGRLAIVFCFGLIHGLGFAGALGIQEAFSWPLLVSLLIFNVGIEAVQLSIILIVFPLLMLLRRRNHRAALWVSGIVTAGVTIMGLIWFVQRLIEG
jgi:HupE / UreJ protein